MSDNITAGFQTLASTPSGAATTEPSDLHLGLDSTSIQQDGTSIFSSVGNVVTKGIPLTAMNIIDSFANTGIKVANIFGANIEEIDQKKQSAAMFGQDYADYYEQNQGAIDFAGLAVGSFIPGMAGLKALKLLQATGKSDLMLGKAVGFFVNNQSKLLADAKDAITLGNGALFPSLNANKYYAIANGFGEQALQALVWETATLATMKANPILEQMDIKDTMLNLATSTLLGGAVGGGIEGLITARSYNKLGSAANLVTAEYANRTYYGGLSPMVGGGDRAAAIVSSMEDASQLSSSSILGVTRRNQANIATLDNAKKFLQAAAPEGDKEIANSLVDQLFSLKQSGMLDSNDIYNTFLRLGKVSRVSLDAAETGAGTIPTGEQWFVNKFAPTRKGSPALNFEDLVSPNLHDGADANFAFRMNMPNTKPVIASFQDTITDPLGNVFPAYKGPREAFASGVDFFIDDKSRVFANRQSDNMTAIPLHGEGRITKVAEQKSLRETGSLPEGSKPLMSEPLVFNSRTGEFISPDKNFSPTVGDIGKPTLINDGLLINRQTVVHNLDNPITADTPAFEANSRYVWASLRGIKDGDTIHTSDIAMLEQLYREGVSEGRMKAGQKTTDFSDYAAYKERRGVSLVDEEGNQVDLPSTADELAGMISEAKKNLGAELTAEGKPIDTVSQVINAPPEFISNGFKTKDFSGATIDPVQHMEPSHFKLEYDLNNFTRSNDGQVARGAVDLSYRIKLIQDAALSAVNMYAGPLSSQLLIDGVSAMEIAQERSGASFLGFSNAGYDSIPQKFERVGRSLSNFISGRNQANVDKLYGPIQSLRSDPQAMQELNNFTFIRRSTKENFQFIPSELATQYGLPKNTAVLSRSLVRDKQGNVFDWDPNFIPPGFLNAAEPNLQVSGLRNYYTLSDKVAALEQVNVGINNERIVHKNNFYVANGMQPRLEPDILYAPPIDTGKYPYFAYVKSKAGRGGTDDSTSIIVARNHEELQEKVAGLADDFDVYFKADLKRFHEVEGDYDYSRNFSQNVVDSALARKGILNNLVPDSGSEGYVRELLDFHAKQETRIARDYVELGNAQLFAEMRGLGQQITASETSKVGYVAAMLGKTAPNPYDDLIKNALAISPKENYRLWQDGQDKLEAFFSSAFEAAKSGFNLAKRDLLPFEDAMKTANNMGIGNVYTNMLNAGKGYEELAYRLPPKAYLSQFVNTANSVMSATAIRLDFFQGLINVISTPVLMLAEAHSATAGIQDMMSTALPGTTQRVPSATKLMFQGVSSFVKNDAERTQITAIMKRAGVIKDNMSDYYSMLDNMTLPGGKLSDEGWQAKINGMVETASKYTGNAVAEEMSRYVPGYIAYKIFSAAGKAGQELEDNIATFVNRVQGGITAHQRPVAFQGPLGQAVGLFQTYQINLMQQMLRYVENGEAKTLAIMAGAQSTLFGINGLPGFQYLNQHIIGAAPGNPSHADAYSALTSPGIGSSITNPGGRSLGDYMLYGVASNFLNTGIYSRGDINPRNISILPINPLDYPAISGGIKLVSSLLDVSSKIASGGSVPASLMLGLEHNGLSRPLSGLAQLMQGYVSTGQGGLIATTRPGLGSNTMGFSDLATAANFGRLLGARPMDEAVVLDSMYRHTLYQAADVTRIKALGESLKTLSDEQGNFTGDAVNDFTAKYTAAGGNVINYGKFILKTATDANSSVANKIYRELQTPANQNLIRSMGGTKLPDFAAYNPYTQGSTQTAPTSNPTNNGMQP